MDTARLGRENWRTLIPQGEDVLESVSLIHDQFIALYLHHAHHQIKHFDLNGNLLGEITLPTLGSLLMLTGERQDDELFYTFNSFVVPPTVYRYDFARDVSDVFWSPSIRFDPSPYETRQVFVTSQDGTRVPLFLVHRQGLANDGSRPTLLYGYGGFNIPRGFCHQPPGLVRNGRRCWRWPTCAAAVSTAKWHQAGMFERKQNVFDDFIACAEFDCRQDHLDAQARHPRRLERRLAGGRVPDAAS
jgi:prolyl oligopeptidase